ncbi:putative RING-H2 finger protein ATL21A [Argentina anserina]|uniref:putative RING-H2 finger protein ATL21A n=1 Tax=Argentina anserina TaxID=57926 RepID=UPI00217656B3|nr:putative RING-H2 finger protein ATL21A [Potentilla anserina]
MHSFIFFILFCTSIFLKTEASTEICETKKCATGAPEIRFPFRVKSQHPQHCGHCGFDLDCSNNETTIHIPSYGELAVKSISYDSMKLELIDPKNCVHGVFLNLNLSLTPFQYYYVMKEYSYLNCSVRLPRSFTEIPCLSGSGYHVYTVKPTFAVPNSCRVVKTVPIPFKYSPYLADNSFGLGLTWNLLGHEDSHEAKVGSLQTEKEQETDCFTMAHVKVCIAILIFVAAAVIIRVNMNQTRKLHYQKQRENQIQVEELLGEYIANMSGRSDEADLKQSNSQHQTVIDIKILKNQKVQV